MKLRKIHVLYFLLIVIHSLIYFLLNKLASAKYELFKFNTTHSLDINIYIYIIAMFITSIVAVMFLGKFKK